MVFNILIQLGITLLLGVLTYLITPRPKQESLKPANKIDFPRSEDGKEIPRVFGTRHIKDPNVVYFGDLKVVAVKSDKGKKD